MDSFSTCFGPKFLLGAAPISHGDPHAAVALLDEAGWTLNLSMKREKDGEKLAVRMVAYPHRPGLAIMQPVMEWSLTALGNEVTATFTGDKFSETHAILDGMTSALQDRKST